jgi:uncharacterized membrane protein
MHGEHTEGRAVNSSLPENEGEREDVALPAIADDDESELARILEALPEEQRGALIQVFERTIAHKGWLPPPEMLEQYEHVLPGLAERIVCLPEREQKHRHAYIDSEGRRAFELKGRGQTYALLAMGMLLAFSTFLAVWGSIEAASNVAIGTIVGVVGIFVTGKLIELKSGE